MCIFFGSRFNLQYANESLLLRFNKTICFPLALVYIIHCYFFPSDSVSLFQRRSEEKSMGLPARAANRTGKTMEPNRKDFVGSNPTLRTIVVTPPSMRRMLYEVVLRVFWLIGGVFRSLSVRFYY
jgi:hypothetical protein